MHCLGNFDEQLARAHDEPRVRVADAGGELIERSRHAGVRICAEQHFTRPRVAFGRERGVANARVLRTVLALQHSLARVELPRAVRVINHIVEIRQALFLYELAEDVHVAIRLGVGGEDVVIGNDDHAVLVPDLCSLTELAFEHANGTRPAHIVRHQHIGFYPNIVPRLNGRFSGGASEQLFSQCHENVLSVFSAVFPGTNVVQRNDV